jgi:chemotaxis protein methyltransferase CheR
MPHLSSAEQKKRPHEQKKTSYPVAHTFASMQPEQKASNKSTAALGTKTNSIMPPEKVVDVDELFSQAIILVEAKSYDDAVKIADKIIMLKPADVRYQTFKAGILMNLNQFQEAESLCLKATTVDPLWLEGHYLAGIIAMQAKRPDDALDRFRKSVYLEPCCWQAHFYLGELQRQRGEKERAIQAFHRAVVCLGLPAANDKDSLFMRINFPVEQVMRMCQYQINILAGKG